MAGVISFVVMTASMLVIGWLVWSRLQRQEAGDKDFQRRIDDDEERARRGREGRE